MTEALWPPSPPSLFDSLIGQLAEQLNPDTTATADSQGRVDWSALARPEQLPPAGVWRVWLILAGRGWGKTRTGAEWLRAQATQHARLGIVAPTFGDARDICVEGESGLLAIARADIAAWNRSLGEVRFTNGARCKLFSGDQPDRLRGPQHHAIWFDELAAFRYADAAWDMAMMGLRLGDDPRVCVTTTPRPLPLIKRLLTDATTHVTRGRTADNAANLAPPFLAQIVARYDGTTLGRQELDGELLEDMPGALWTRAVLEATRVSAPDPLRRVVVAVDPSATAGGDACGIVVAGVGEDGHGYVLDDRTLQASPAQWAAAAVAAYHTYHADALVAEANQGGEMVRLTIGTVPQAPPVTLVHASRGKHTRAEPVAALYEQGRVHHVGTFGPLEDELTSWTDTSPQSPNRLDALVWALTHLQIAGASGQAIIDHYLKKANAA